MLFAILIDYRNILKIIILFPYVISYLDSIEC